ncbi:YIP1 family protein [Candidatus Aenigmatarchaeota archaeon]
MSREEEVRKAMQDAQREERDEQVERGEERPSNEPRPVELGFFKKIKMAMFNPSYLFDSVRGESIGGALLFHLAMNFIGVLILGLFLFTIGSFLTAMLSTIPFASMFAMIIMLFFGIFFVIFVVVFLISSIIGNFIGAGILHIFVKLFGGKGSYGATYKSTSYAAAPMIFLGIPLLNIISAFWSIVITIVGLSTLHKISRGRAALAFFTPAIIGVVVVVYVISTAMLGSIIGFLPSFGSIPFISGFGSSYIEGTGLDGDGLQHNPDTTTDSLEECDAYCVSQGHGTGPSLFNSATNECTCWYEPPPGQDALQYLVSECEELDPGQQDACYWPYALNTLDDGYCQQVSSMNRQTCIDDVQTTQNAVDLQDDSLCQQVLFNVECYNVVNAAGS